MAAPRGDTDWYAKMIQCIHGACLLAYLHDLLHTLDHAAVLLCGDFNMLPTSTLYEWFAGNVHPHEFYHQLQDLVKAAGVSPLIDLPALHHFSRVESLSSAYKSFHGREPVFTNLTRKFRGCLDYIWFGPTERLGVISFEKELYDLKDLGQVKHLPNEEHPSDHLPLCCTFGWLKIEKEKLSGSREVCRSRKKKRRGSFLPE